MEGINNGYLKGLNLKNNQPKLFSSDREIIEEEDKIWKKIEGINNAHLEGYILKIHGQEDFDDAWEITAV